MIYWGVNQKVQGGACGSTTNIQSQYKTFVVQKNVQAVAQIKCCSNHHTIIE